MLTLYIQTRIKDDQLKNLKSKSKEEDDDSFVFFHSEYLNRNIPFGVVYQIKPFTLLVLLLIFY